LQMSTKKEERLSSCLKSAVSIGVGCSIIKSLTFSFDVAEMRYNFSKPNTLPLNHLQFVPDGDVYTVLRGLKLTAINSAIHGLFTF